MRSRPLAAGAGAALVAACAAAAGELGELVDPRLVGRYEWWAIDSGRFLELAGDGTWREGDVGMGALPFTECGRWRVVDGRIELQLTHTGGTTDPGLRLPPAVELRPDGRYVPWQRVAAVPQAPR
jgi:hypothetical protein